jgi:hypothetical protein
MGWGLRAAFIDPSAPDPSATPSPFTRFQLSLLSRGVKTRAWIVGNSRESYLTDTLPR